MSEVSTISPSSPQASPGATDAPPCTPVKRIKNQADVEVFRSTEAYRKVRAFVDGCCVAVRGLKRSEAPLLSDAPQYLQALANGFKTLRDWVAEIPLHDMSQQRFGNKAFRDLHDRIDALAVSAVIRPVVEAAAGYSSSVVREDLECELLGYLKDSFGNSTRIDFGTGHELHFFLFLMVLLEAAGVSSLSNEEDQRAILRVVVLRTFWDYLDFMRLLQKHYSLEPAGSHGVWGLDDYHHLPFIFGAAQLSGADDPASPAQSPILPKHITDRSHVDRLRGEYMYFEMIGWIMDNKKGPFHEHSSVLYNVSGIDQWSRIEGGMIKMYDGEVLNKYNIVQHLLFGPHFPFVKGTTASDSSPTL